MTDLTEQWKKGELPEGEYWVKYIYGDIERLDYCWKTFNDNGYPINNETIEQVLAPVPSYEKWKVKLEENAQLKELLERCRDKLFEIYSNEVSHPEDVPIIKKLDEVLKD